ncbi:hypothetical protein SBRCBS47491_002700 [Sporothrix bragantina]|uniref:CENP-V/GFA domain-containing protein n=1 Tax=Sporothrix bragantina TaxID=671064 RepID=A0ABP0B908_9PEZI
MAEPTPTPAPASPEAPESTPDDGFVITCQCGQVRLRTPSSTPIGICHCHCTECRRQSASAFGTSVYFPPAEGFYPLDPTLTAPGGTIGTISRPTDSGNTMYCYFCRGCGVRLLHAVILPDGSIRPRVSVKGGAIEDPEGKLDWAGAKHIFVRSAVIPLSPTWETYDTTLANGPRFVPAKEAK